MSSVIYSNRRDFFTNHRNKLDSLGIFFFRFLWIVCLSVLYFDAKFKTNHGILF